VILYQVDGPVEDVLVLALQLGLNGALGLSVNAVDPEVLFGAALRVDEPLVDGLDDVGDVGIGRRVLLEPPADDSARIRTQSVSIHSKSSALLHTKSIFMSA